MISELPTIDQRQADIKILIRPLFLWGLPFTFLNFGLPIYSKSLGASALEIGGMLSTFTITTLALRPLVGWILDRFGRRWIFVFSLALYALAMFLFAIADTIPMLYVAKMAQGAGSSLLWVSINTMIADMAHRSQRGLYVGLVNEVIARSGIIGMVLGFIFLFLTTDEVAWHTAFSIFTVTTLAGVVIAWRTVPETKPVLQSQKLPKYSVDRRLMWLMAVVFVAGASEAMLWSNFMIFMLDKFTTDMMSLAWVLFPANIIYSLIAARLGGLNDRFDRVKMLALGLCCSALSSLLIPFVPSLFWMSVMFLLTEISWGLSGPAKTSLVADLTGVERRGLSYGLFEMISNMGMAAGPLLGGLLYDTVNPSAPFFVNAGVLFFSVVWIFFFLQRIVRNGQEEE